jgi:(E)-4-hydroxy-3-methylbut-2-enyl-diphosphate synthase
MVNGPGESKEADLGVACGKGVGVLYGEGRLLRRVGEKEIIPALLEEARKIARKRRKA